MGHMQNEKHVFVQKQLINKSSFQKPFILQKFHLYESLSNLCEGWSNKKRFISSLKHLWRFYLPIIASFTFSSALLSADTYIASYPPEFH